MDVQRRCRELDEALVQGDITEQTWFSRIRDLIETLYLSSDNPQAQSGLGGDATHWERRRQVLVEAVTRDGTFLDVGCANGLLMETLVAWAASRGIHLEPYGLDISAKLVAVARRRLPAWSDHMFAGNVIEWMPPFRFDYVFTALEYVPRHRQPELVARLLDRVVAPGGRLVIVAYRSRGNKDAGPIADWLSGWGFVIGGEAVALDGGDGGVATRLVWLDALPDQ
ncbi:MAG: class I SAM-dependent methyltransferase [Chloroflexota bacterium]|nr:class I SAM-dependent methyltransferase [Chloroflexota bacterium]